MTNSLFLVFLSLFLVLFYHFKIKLFKESVFYHRQVFILVFFKISNEHRPNHVVLSHIIAHKGLTNFFDYSASICDVAFVHFTNLKISTFKWAKFKCGFIIKRNFYKSFFTTNPFENNLPLYTKFLP